MNAAGSARLNATPRSAARIRTLHAASSLFAERGVRATSLQMIADRLGVTKAAVYHQFTTKEEIIIGVTEMQLGQLERALDDAESDADWSSARVKLLDLVIDLAVDQRHMVGLLQNDPIIIRLLAEHEPFQRFLRRLYTALIGEETGPRSLVQAAMVSGTIGSAVKHPLVADLDDETLKVHLRRLTTVLIDTPAPKARKRAKSRGISTNKRRRREVQKS